VGIILPEDERREVAICVPDRPYFLNDRPVRNEPMTISAESCGNRQLLRPANPADDDGVIGVIVRDIPAGRGFHFASRLDVRLPGDIEITACDGRLLVVNELSIESYLKGVITSEMSPDCPVEFFKAQAVAARSWMLAASERKHADLGVDFCNDDCCQRYQGLGALSESAAYAVNETAGEVLIHKSGVIVDANYSKCCGGVTEDPADIWGVAKPGQQSVADPYCGPEYVTPSDIPRYLGRVDDGKSNHRWTVEISAADLLANIARHHPEAGTACHILDIRVEGRGKGGRAIALTLMLADADGRPMPLILRSEYAIRQTLHPDFLYSSAFDIDLARGGDHSIQSVTLHGAGWGHGAGLCQIGALGMALACHDYQRILHHYFTDVAIRRLDPP
jgi:SpoIID/LytB domain protein